MFAVLKNLNWFFRQEQKRYSIGLFLLMFTGILELGPPAVIGIAIDSMMHGTNSWSSLSFYILFILILLAAKYGLTYIWMTQVLGGPNRLERQIRLRFMKHLLGMTPPFFERHRTGDLMARATNDLRSVADTVGLGLLTLTDSTVKLSVIFLTMSTLISWKLTLAAVIPLPFIAIAMKIYGKIIHERYTEAQDAFGDMNDVRML